MVLWASRIVLAENELSHFATIFFPTINPIEINAFPWLAAAFEIIKQYSLVWFGSTYVL